MVFIPRCDQPPWRVTPLFPNPINNLCANLLTRALSWDRDAPKPAWIGSVHSYAAIAATVCQPKPCQGPKPGLGSLFRTPPPTPQSPPARPKSNRVRFFKSCPPLRPPPSKWLRFFIYQSPRRAPSPGRYLPKIGVKPSEPTAQMVLELVKAHPLSRKCLN
jgi:hypothetical protein